MHSLNALPYEKEQFNNKSIQRKIFDESMSYHLRGDDDSFNVSFVENQTSYVKSNEISMNRISQKEDQDSTFRDQKSHLDTSELNSIKSQKSQNFDFNIEHAQQVEVVENFQKQNMEETINSQRKKKKERQVYFNNEDSNIILESQKFAQLIKLNQMSLKKEENNELCYSSVQENNQNKQMKQTQRINMKPYQEKQNLSKINYQRAASIINKVIGKSANRVERINLHVKNFVTILKQLKQNRKLPHIEDEQCQFLKDLSYLQQVNVENKRKMYVKFLKNLLSYCRIPIALFMPTDTFRIYWDFFQVFLTYSFLYIYSIILFFCQNEQEDTHQIQFVFKLTFVLFLLDILVNFNTCYFNKDTIVISRKKIAWKYMYSSVFITDFLFLFILGCKFTFQKNLIYNQNNNMFVFIINLILFSKINGCQDKRNRLYFVFNLTENEKHLIRLGNQIVNVVSVAHLVSLCWYFIGSYEVYNGYQISWLHKYNILELNYLERYVYSMYWAITTMTTVGYGDIAATNYREATFIIFAMILFSCMFAYSINSIGFILQEIEKSSKQLNDSITTVQRQNQQFNSKIKKNLIQNLRYLNRKNVNIPLQSRVRHYLQFLSKEQRDRNLLAENEILSTLTKKLRDEITIEINQRILKNYQIFQFNFSEQTLLKIAFIMQELQISPNEIIFEQGDSEDQSIYLIESGIIEIYQLVPPSSNLNVSKLYKNNSTHVLKKLKKKELFGEISFFTGLARKAYARSLNLSTLYKIDRNQFINILKENSEDFERFKMIEEQIKIQKNLNCISIECYICKQHGHIASDCPLIHQHFDSQFQKLKFTFSIFQNRSSAKRRKKKQNPKQVIFNRFITKKFKNKFRQVIMQNAEICKNLKKQLRHFNTQVEGYFNSDIDFLSQFSYSKANDQVEEYQTSTGQSSECLELSQKSQNFEKKDIKFKSETLKSQISKISEKQQINSNSQNSSVSEILIQNENENFTNQVTLKNIQSQKLIQNAEIDVVQQRSIPIRQQISVEAENSQDEANLENSKSQNQMQRTNSNIRLYSNLNSFELNQKSKKIEKKNTNQINNQSKKMLSQEDIYLSNLSDEETINPIQKSSSQRKISKSVSNKNKQQCEQQARSAFEILNLLNTNLFKNLIYQSSQNAIQSTSTIHQIEDTINDFTKMQNQEQNPFLPSLNQQNHSLKNVYFHSNQNEQSSNNFSSKSLQLLGMPSELITPFQNKNSQKDILQFVEEILKKNGKNLKQFKHVLDECDHVSMNNFDKIKIYQRFFPHNNFSHIFSKKQIDYKKVKEVKNHVPKVTKGRRNNILMASILPRKSMFFNDLIKINNNQPEINLDSYKPTFLSYGVCNKNVSLYPKVFQKHRNQNNQ